MSQDLRDIRIPFTSDSSSLADHRDRARSREAAQFTQKPMSDRNDQGIYSVCDARHTFAKAPNFRIRAVKDVDPRDTPVAATDTHGQHRRSELLSRT